MPEQSELLVEAEARGILPPDKQALLDEARSRGLIQPKATSDVRREMAMTPDAYDKLHKGRLARGEFSRGQPTTSGMLIDKVADPIGLNDEMIGAGEYVSHGVAPAFGHMVYDAVRPVANAFGADLEESKGSYSDDLARGDKAYNEAVTRKRAERAVINDKLGYASIPVDLIAGGAGAKIKAGQNVAKGVNALGGWLNGVGQSAKVGAGFGLATGVATGEGGLVERGISGLEGAATGAVAGPVLSHVVAPAASALVRGIRNLPSGVRAARTAVSGNPDAILYRGLQRQDMTPRQAQLYLDTGQDLATFGKATTPLPETIADSGPATQRLVRAVEGRPGAGATQAERFLNERQRGTPRELVPEKIQNPAYVPKSDPNYVGAPKTLTNPEYVSGQHERINDQFQRGLKVTGSDFGKTKARLAEEQKTASDPLYKQFRDTVDQNGQPVEINVGEILRRSEMADPELAPALKATLQKARAQFQDEVIARDMGPGLNGEVPLGKEAVLGRAPTARLSPARFDSGKQAVDEMIAKAQANGQNNTARLLIQLQKELIAEADKVAPVYAQARDAFSSPARMTDALAEGRAFMKGDSEVTGAQYRAKSTGEKKMFRIGMAKQAKVDTGGKVTGGDRVGYFDRPNVQDILQEIMSKDEYLRHVALHQRESGMLRTLNKTKNSQTGQRLADIEDMDWLSRQAEGIKDRGAFGYVTHLAAEGVKRLTRMREKDAQILANMLFETDPAKQRAITQRLEATYGRPRTQRGIAAAVREVRRMERSNGRALTARAPSPALMGEATGRGLAIREDANATP